MKKIGYIYRYNDNEKKGILMYGYNRSNRSVYYLKFPPILFSLSDCISSVKTGQLVYFDLDDKTVSNIERASLSNFKYEFINSLIRCKENESEDSFFIDNTIISFERLDNIIIPNEDNQKQIENTLVDDDFVFWGWDLKGIDETADSSFTMVHDSVITNENNNHLPETIQELFNCFGKYKHRFRKESTSVNVIDLSLWVDSEVLNTEYYGKKVDELLFLYNLFVLKKRYNKNGYEIPVKLANDCISSLWSLLLSKFNDEDLKKIIYEAPILQPALPVDFCLNNAAVLTDDYGMPNVEICKSYCMCQISNADNISDYEDLKHKFYVYRNCTATHLEGEGTPMCKMGITRIKNLEKRLEEQYENVIKKNVLAYLLELSGNVAIVDELKTATPDEFNKVGIFLDNYKTLKSDFLDFEVYDNVMNSYEKLPRLYQNALKKSLFNCVNESAISATHSNELSPFRLTYNIGKFGNWVLDSTKLRIKELVNDRFSKLDDLEELSCAYKAGYITGKQYYYRYKQITSNFTTEQFLMEISDSKMNESPLLIQWYVVSSIINLLGYDSLNSFEYVKVKYMDAISGIRSLLKWFANYAHLKDVVLKKAEEKICSVLSDGERWTLFEEKIVQTPGTENIRKRLDEAYKTKYAEQELFKHSCFQDVMLSDADSIKDSNVLQFIADNLDAEHQYLMQQKATGFLKLYLWQKRPTANYDWSLIKAYYHELSVDAQIKILRYIFGQMSSGDCSLSLDDLYSEFVETTTPACSAICGILYILKEKKTDMNVSITASMVESVIGKDRRQLFNFLKDSKDFFYTCNGYLAISANIHDSEYQAFNGFMLKEIKNDELYYVVRFYESPVDLFGNTIDWLINSEYVEIAKQVLLKNTYVEVINDKYYIHESHEFFVKQFVIAFDIDDRCGLMSDKVRMIEQSNLHRNNEYQPHYTNYLRRYEDSDNYVCRCGIYGGSDSENNIPFFWCNKKMCVRRAHFLLPPLEWGRYRFADLLFIALGQSPDIRESVWRVNSEISQFICDYARVFRSNERIINSKPLEEIEERGTWDEASSVYRDIYDYDDSDEYEEYYEEYSSDNERPTYNRYNGSYAQDEMGYSDDDIDTIFDGDPSAYWNID